MHMPEINDHLGDGTTGPRKRGRRLPFRFRRRASAAMSPCDERYLQRIHDFRQLLNGEWHWDVLVALHEHPLRYMDLLNTIHAQMPMNNWPGRAHRHLQDGTLSRTLHRLMEAELVERDSVEHFPFPVTYRLTSAARELLVVMASAAEWVEANRDLLLRVQNRRHGDAGD